MLRSWQSLRRRNEQFLWVFDVDAAERRQEQPPPPGDESGSSGSFISLYELCENHHRIHLFVRIKYCDRSRFQGLGQIFTSSHGSAANALFLSPSGSAEALSRLMRMINILILVLIFYTPILSPCFPPMNMPSPSLTHRCVWRLSEVTYTHRGVCAAVVSAGWRFLSPWHHHEPSMSQWPCPGLSLDHWTDSCARLQRPNGNWFFVFILDLVTNWRTSLGVFWVLVIRSCSDPVQILILETLWVSQSDVSVSSKP